MLLLQRGDQVEDLLLDRHVERGRRLVGDQQLGLAGDRHRDHHPLLLAARHLRRIGVDLEFRVGDADLGQQRDRALPRLRRPHAHVHAQHLGQLEADGEHRVQRCHRLLEDHRDVGAADLAQFVLAELDQIPPAVDDLAARQHRRIFLGQQAEDRKRGDRLAAARFADQRDGGVGRDVEADALHRFEGGVLVEAEVDPKIADRQKGRGHRCFQAGHSGRRRGAVLVISVSGPVRRATRR